MARERVRLARERVGLARERVGLAREGPGKEWDWQETGPGKSVTVRGMACKCHEMGRGLALPPRDHGN